MSPLQGEEEIINTYTRGGAAKRRLPRAKLCNAFGVKDF
jgi:hypothetical protein